MIPEKLKYRSAGMKAFMLGIITKQRINGCIETTFYNNDFDEAWDSGWKHAARIISNRNKRHAVRCSICQCFASEDDIWMGEHGVCPEKHNKRGKDGKFTK